MEEGKRGRTGGRQREDEFRLGHMECEMPGDMSRGHVEGCRSPVCREGRVECQRLHGQDHEAWSLKTDHCVRQREGWSCVASARAFAGTRMGQKADSGGLRVMRARGQGRGRGGLLCPLSPHFYCLRSFPVHPGNFSPAQRVQSCFQSPPE